MVNSAITLKVSYCTICTDYDSIEVGIRFPSSDDGSIPDDKNQLVKHCMDTVSFTYRHSPFSTER